MTTITIPNNLIKNDDLIIVEKKHFETLAKENDELRLAMKAVVIGEAALRQKKTRSLKDFLKSQSLYGKNS